MSSTKKNREKKPRRLRDQPTFTINRVEEYPPLRLPQSPPTVQEAINLVEKLITKPKLARFPNSFIIYRNMYVRYLKDNGYSIPMTHLSSMVGRSWKMEPYHIKEAYRKISSEAEQLYDQIIGSNHPQEPFPVTPPSPMNGFVHSNEDPSYHPPSVASPHFPCPSNEHIIPPNQPSPIFPSIPMDAEFIGITFDVLNDIENDDINKYLIFPSDQSSTPSIPSIPMGTEFFGITFDVLNDIENDEINKYFNFRSYDA
ncbi:903_t:CDS:1 [Acaulospora morrowiae]|uniref:903_t:CDS:1 n=1 Tax=Acaulospora morrowiae TaxID=94023 RepID=A0A9N9F3Q4_9GLOM|nr:903_t:CDS:1 [Acaulospora morrowiae]